MSHTLLLAFALACPTLQAAPQADHTAFQIRDPFSQPLLQESEDGRTWARLDGLRASFGPEGFCVYPAFGAGSEREWPVLFTLDRAHRSGATLADENVRDVSVHRRAGAPTSVTLDRGNVREIYHVTQSAIEQTFVLDEAHGFGDLVVDLQVTTELVPVVTAAGIEFRHPELGGVRYGDAYVLDATGRKEPITRSLDDGRITLTVPAAFLADAVYPVTIDPPVTPIINTFGSPDDSLPDIVYAGQAGRYLVCWEDATSSQNSDVYVTSFERDGTQLATIPIDVTNGDWWRPRIAYAAALDRVLVVANTRISSIGVAIHSVRGQFVDASSSTPFGHPFPISSLGSSKDGAVVGGTNRPVAGEDQFVVAWTYAHSAIGRGLRYRIVRADGNAMGTITTVEDRSHVRAIQPAVSPSLGDTSSANDQWSLVWIEDVGTDERGPVRGRRIDVLGSPQVGGGTFTVDAREDCRNPSVSSRLDRSFAVAPDGVSVVAYERGIGSAGSLTSSNIEVAVVTSGRGFASQPLSTRLEGLPNDRLRVSPKVATNGVDVTIVYGEESRDPSAPGTFDLYAATASLLDEPTRVRLGLAERHALLYDAPTSELDPGLAMERDGDASSVTGAGACIWTIDYGGGQGQLRGTTWASPIGVSEQAAGYQVCRAHPNSLGDLDGFTNSWLWIRGDQRRTSVHEAIALDLPTQSFGYLLASRDSGHVDLVGGGRGLLCLGGSIGRYVGQLTSSGAAGRIVTTIDPAALPQPTGQASAGAGESWYFQLWHRDTHQGVPTSNLTGACCVMFLD